MILANNEGRGAFLDMPIRAPALLHKNVVAVELMGFPVFLLTRCGAVL
jgi:hypothetical protein